MGFISTDKTISGDIQELIILNDNTNILVLHNKEYISYDNIDRTLGRLRYITLGEINKIYQATLSSIGELNNLRLEIVNGVDLNIVWNYTKTNLNPFIIYVKNSKLSYVLTTMDKTISIPDCDRGETYLISIKYVDEIGRTSNLISNSITIEPELPTDIPSVTYKIVKNSIELRWDTEYDKTKFNYFDVNGIIYSVSKNRYKLIITDLEIGSTYKIKWWTESIYGSISHNYNSDYLLTIELKPEVPYNITNLSIIPYNGNLLARWTPSLSRYKNRVYFKTDNEEYSTLDNGYYEIPIELGVDNLEIKYRTLDLFNQYSIESSITINGLEPILPQPKTFSYNWTYYKSLLFKFSFNELNETDKLIFDRLEIRKIINNVEDNTVVLSSNDLSLMEFNYIEAEQNNNISYIIYLVDKYGRRSPIRSYEP